ncbi:sulfite exporter TauE/SafE family protein [Primorskyibacter sp. S187A]|uniref:sulfite exporter TauE/SafE family protein n=1 Tax=Primorskyibacter sp. S187A TaxID=3415130 RepID=UPI003C7999DE
MGGAVKGVVGFAMPTILISLLGAFLPPQIALAGMMLPTLITNAMQSLRGGRAAAIKALRQFKVFMIAGACTLVLAAQLYAFLPQWVLLASIGGPVVLFCVLQIIGWRTEIREQRRAIEAGFGGVAGFIGGLSGVWGPPTVAYLTALNTDKALQVRTQGIAFGLGTLLLMAAHGPSGVVRADTMTFSAALCIPGVLGMWVGLAVQDRINQQTFRRVTLWVLLVAGVNLLRRAWLVY